MSAANAPVMTPELNADRRAHEPSMEEILASIRRIIADDDGFTSLRRERTGAASERPARVEPPAPAMSAAYAAPALEPRNAWRRPLAEPPAQPLPREEPRPTLSLAAAPEPAPEPEPEPEPDYAAYDYAASEPEEAQAYAEEDAETDAAPPQDVTAEAAPETGAPLMSTDASASIASHFQALAASMIINDAGLLQRYAQEMLRPMLKQWLDDNLPVIVERLVRAEIERVARGARR